MTNSLIKIITSLCVILTFSTSLTSQTNAMWEEINLTTLNNKNVIYYKAIPKQSKFYKLNRTLLTAALTNIPKRGEANFNEGVNLSFPNPNGNLEQYLVLEASVMTPELQAQFPNIRSFVGKSKTNPSAVLRFSFSPEKGLSSMVLSDSKTVFIEPYSNDYEHYVTFINSPEDKNNQQFVCETESKIAKPGISDEDFKALRNANDGILRTYRLALACTVEYSQFHGGTLSSVMAAMNTTMTRVNGVYERDLSLTMVMVPNQNIIFLGPDPSSDPYSNSSGLAMLSQNQTTIDNVIGTFNYDIGHVFSTGGGGIASLNSPCNITTKARGVTGLFNPVGDAFDIDYVCHEMGHQYGANHTQNNNCQRSAISVEPGSASTIMGYAGICAPNVQNNSDDYFHGESIKEMWANVSSGISSSCFQPSDTDNAAPLVDAGANYSIPKSTAFALTGLATDTDTAPSSLTYCWEQNDTEVGLMPPQSTNTGGPVFRSLDPTTSPTRYFPALPTVMSGDLSSTWEVIPSTARTMGFLLTVRDNEPGGGATNSDEMQITVEDVTPFTVNTPPSWAPASNQEVSWVVGETANATINCQSVNILFTTNNGATFTILAANVPNTGSATVLVPNVPLTNNAKILVEAADNVFYAVSDAFSISNVPDFSLNTTSGDQVVCNEDSANFTFSYTTSNGFSENTVFSVSGVPTGVNFNITPNSTSVNETITLELSNLNVVPVDDYTITLTATSPSIVRSEVVTLTISDGVCTSEGNLNFDTKTTRVIFNTIDNATPGPKVAPYVDFTNLSTDVEAGSSYDLTTNVDTDGNFQVITRVWIDWNQNCSFNDPGEEYNLGTTANVVDQPSDLSPLSITVPTSAANGSTIMRVSTKYTDPGANQVPTSCEVDFDGEVEDYTINVINNLSTSDEGIDSFKVYPNPNQGVFNLQFTSLISSSLSVRVYDLRGRVVFEKNYNNPAQLNKVINLNDPEAGVYLLQVSQDSNKTIRKLIIE